MPARHVLTRTCASGWWQAKEDALLVDTLLNTTIDLEPEFEAEMRKQVLAISPDEDEDDDESDDD